jgi:hypothetical protein
MNPKDYVRLWSIAFCLFGAFPASGSPFQEKLPQLVRLTGTFSPVIGQDAGALPYLLEISIDGKPRTFYMREAKSLTSDDRGPQILRNLGALLVLIGSPPLLDRLAGKEAFQALLQLEGRLYIEKRTLALSSVLVENSPEQ